MRAASAAFYCCKGGGGRWARALRSQRGAAARSARAPRWGGQEQERARAQPSPAQPSRGKAAARAVSARGLPAGSGRVPPSCCCCCAAGPGAGF